VGGTLLMALSVAAMAFAPATGPSCCWRCCRGVGNSVIHPADYAILGASIDKARIGRAFALHTFTGNSGFAAGPPVVAACCWRWTGGRRC
jgi:MFS family permease